MRILIDTDPGVDDALALAVGFSLRLRIAALTTVHGNTHVTNSTRNAGYIARSLRSDWRIYEGASRPLKGKGGVSYAHGAGGLGDLTPLPSQVTAPEPISAAAFYRLIAEGSEVYALLCLGPTTNIASAIAANPQLLDRIGKLVIMGGAFAERGNVTKYAEFNVHKDPLALRIVLDQASKRGVDTTIIPAETCREVVLTAADLVGLEQSSLVPNIRSIVEPYLKYYLNRATDNNYNGAVLYDALVPLYYLRPDLFTTKPVRVNVVQEGERIGQTVAADDDQSSVKITTAVDVATARATILQALGT